jgi:hypothetical protein
MNTLDERQLEMHVRVLGWLFIVQQIFMLIIAAFVFALLVGVGVAIPSDQEVLPILSTVATVVVAFLVLLSIPGFIAGFGLLARKSWARYLAIVVGLLSLFNVPIGTITGLYALFVLFQETANEYFK